MVHINCYGFNKKNSSGRVVREHFKCEGCESGRKLEKSRTKRKKTRLNGKVSRKKAFSLLLSIFLKMRPPEL